MLKRKITILLFGILRPSIIALTTLSAYAYPANPVFGVVIWP
jgi:hypothetical protein